MHSPGFNDLHATIRRIATETAAIHADDVDARARFPAESIGALREAHLLSAGVPHELGGFGLGLAQLASLTATLAQGCAASGMVYAMHLIEVACLVRHGLESPWIRGYLAELTQQQRLIASITSEVGTSGDTRSSICAIVREGDTFRLEKAATTVSYGVEADALLVTARRAPDASASDQVLVLLRRADCSLTTTSTWDTLGMRGTCSPGGQLVAQAGIEQIVPGTFAEASAQTMVPYSHVLWSALWWGIAADAMARAGTFVRAQARKDPGSMPPAATALAGAASDLQAMQQLWQASATAYDALGDGSAAREALMSMAWALRFNHLKVQASDAAPRIVHQALQIIGVMGYRNDSKFSVGRHYRDSLSASLMISNERLAAKSAAMLLVVKDV